jgi:hypothetical protein
MCSTTERLRDPQSIVYMILDESAWTCDGRAGWQRFTTFTTQRLLVLLAELHLHAVCLVIDAGPRRHINLASAKPLRLTSVAGEAGKTQNWLTSWLG